MIRISSPLLAAGRRTSFSHNDKLPTFRSAAAILLPIALLSFLVFGLAPLQDQTSRSFLSAAAKPSSEAPAQARPATILSRPNEHFADFLDRVAPLPPSPSSVWSLSNLPLLGSLKGWIRRRRSLSEAEPGTGPESQKRRRKRASHSPAVQTGDLIWLTLADGFYARTATAHLDYALLRMLPIHATRRGFSSRRHTLVILCLDEECMDVCQENRYTACYAEYQHNRPEIMLEATWPKLAGIIDTLEAGRDVMFCDSDIFVKGNPFDQMKQLGAFDFQIQDEGLRGHVNTGFIHISPTAASIAHWRSVLNMDLVSVSRDQANTNFLLGTRPPAEGPEGTGVDVSHFDSLNGLSVSVIPPTTVWAYHLYLERRSVPHMNAVAFHGTCLDNAAYKYLVARDFGYWQDVSGYYSEPPRMLVLPSLAGSEAELRGQVSAWIELALKTDRSLVPPAQVQVRLDDGQIKIREFSTTFDLEDLVFTQKFPVLEPAYIAHALPYNVPIPEVFDDDEDQDDEDGIEESEVGYQSIATRASNFEALLERNEINVDAYNDISSIASRLNEQDYASKLVVTLSGWDAPTIEHLVRDSKDAKQLSQSIAMCKDLAAPPTCAQLCRK